MNSEMTRLAPLLVASGVGLLWNALRRFRTLRRIEDTARSKTASAPQGHVELQGIAWPEGDEALVSPSGTEVVHYSLKIEREKRQGKRKVWTTVFRKDHAPSFYLVDATGLVRVDPRGAELNLGSRGTRNWRTVSHAERERILEYTAGQGIAGFPPSEFLFGLFAARFRVVESEIRVGSPLYSHGEFRTTHGSQELVRARGLTGFHKRFFDPVRREQKRPGDLAGNERGLPQTDLPVGLCQAAASSRDAALAAASEESEFAVHGQLTTSDRHKLFIADRHEEQLVQGMARSFYLPFVGGVAALSAALLLVIGNFDGASSTPPAPPATPAAITQPRPQPASHSALRSQCATGQAAACDELLRRANELRIRDADRQDYARRACALGLLQHCPSANAP